LDVCVGNCLHVGQLIRCAWVGWCVLSRCCVCVSSELCLAVRRHSVWLWAMVVTQAVLDDWANMLPKFWQVVPPSESMTPEVVDDESMVATTA